MRTMALLLLVSLLAAAAAATSNTSDNVHNERGEEETRRIFLVWKAELGKTYSSAAEEERAYSMFKHRLRDIDQGWHEDGYSAWSWNRERSEEETRRIFAEWKATNDKMYSSIDHEKHRYAIFKDALRQVDRNNAGYAIGVDTNHQGINGFTDLTLEEFSVVCSGFILEGFEPSLADLRREAEIQERLRLVYAPPSLWAY
ncbi:hypothetical protein CFC21_105906 [Triticum aestivum]|uniref:Cathepsin propeptide inhibitor domain-containing protein n=2 Tax=Triticum aestivum TaxID=4565 RepID=A0A9R1MD60_WHEAT|nr:uncharacterized protein LOC123160881 [Triticum aestivum]KAF7105065.1 hypothetical protein CFC21_105906 [Triticum aestivum]